MCFRRQNHREERTAQRSCTPLKMHKKCLWFSNGTFKCQKRQPLVCHSNATNSALPFYAAYPLDRAADLRKQPTKLEALLLSANATFIPVQGSKCLIQTPASENQEVLGCVQPVKLCYPGAKESMVDIENPPIFLGLDTHGAGYFAVEIQSDEAQGFASAHHGQWQNVRQLQDRLSKEDAALLAVATGLSVWHQSYLYDGRTGARTVSSSGGHARKDPTTNKSTYPRIDPAVIVLVTCGPFCLLGRKHEWRAGLYSTLAGFLELGETLEMCVIREVQEESGVQLTRQAVKYYGSQPWPFPQSLMVGFACEAAPLVAADPVLFGFDLLPTLGRQAALEAGLTASEVTEVLGQKLQSPNANEAELEDVRWFHRDYLRKALMASGAQLSIPGPYSMAHMLITPWVQAESPPLEDFPQVQIDDGKFKYVLMRVSDNSGSSKLLVWGDKRAAYHNNILERANNQARKLGLRVDVLGGGRIEHYPEIGTILVYGYSSAFGPAPHELSTALLRKWYPVYHAESISLSYEGY